VYDSLAVEFLIDIKKGVIFLSCDYLLTISEFIMIAQLPKPVTQS